MCRPVHWTEAHVVVRGGICGALSKVQEGMDLNRSLGIKHGNIQLESNSSEYFLNQIDFLKQLWERHTAYQDLCAGPRQKKQADATA